MAQLELLFIEALGRYMKFQALPTHGNTLASCPPASLNTAGGGVTSSRQTIRDVLPYIERSIFVFRKDTPFYINKQIFAHF